MGKRKTGNTRKQKTNQLRNDIAQDKYLEIPRMEPSIASTTPSMTGAKKLGGPLGRYLKNWIVWLRSNVRVEQTQIGRGVAVRAGEVKVSIFLNWRKDDCFTILLFLFNVNPVNFGIVIMGLGIILEADK